MKHYTLFVIGLLAGCSNADMAMMAGGATGKMDYLAGRGWFSQSANGQSSFTFVVPDEAGFGYESTPATRVMLLESWLGKENRCASGYKIDSRSMTMAKGYEYFEGHCR